MQHLLLYFFILTCYQVHASAQSSGFKFNGSILDKQTHDPLEFAVVQLKGDNEVWYGSTSDIHGCFSFGKVPGGHYTATISYLGYETLTVPVNIQKDENSMFYLSSSSISLNEVIVTASESKGNTSASRIDHTAMEHLQPSSLADLMELLPGGKSIDPDMSTPNLISIREAGTSNQSISSQGVSFVMDGMSISNNANLQYIPGTTKGSSKEFVSKGIDMRSIPTDNIESMEVVRGIPSVEYGNLTNGMVTIKRKQNASPWYARFKADQVSKLFSTGKGWELNGSQTLNADINYLNSQADPRDSRENYKRITTSVRWNGNKAARLGQFKWHIHGDYTGSFDQVKRDKDITAKEDAYRASYNRLTLNTGLGINRDSRHTWQGFNTLFTLSQAFDEIREQKSVSLDRPMAAPNSTETGESDGVYLPYHYLAEMTIDGKPIYVTAKASTSFFFNRGKSRHILLAGSEWNLSKNWGNGRVYDMNRPLNTAGTTRPRRYKDIPTYQAVSAYLEDKMTIPIQKHVWQITAGIRSTALPGLSSQYAMNGKIYIDPRLNMQWKLPAAGLNKDWEIEFSGGIGIFSMMPSTAQLYPDDKYTDVVELNYYHNHPAYRRIHLMTYRWGNVNYQLTPARNLKWEVRGIVSLQGNELSVTYFRERMNNGFSDLTYFRLFPYRNYDASSVSSQALTGPPALEDLVSRTDTLIDTYTTTGNGTRVRKEGIEFVFSSKRIQLLKTRFTMTGAWIKTTYSNCLPKYESSSILINGQQLQYVGLYNEETGICQERFNTNFMADTYLQKIGMTFSLAAQCTWFTAQQSLWNSGMPASYVDKNGQVHPFTSEDAEKLELQHLVKRYSDEYFSRNTVPFAMDINLKATKEIGRQLRLSLFVNRIITFYPDYYRGSQHIRRSSSPYFGMEANLRI